MYAMWNNTKFKLLDTLELNKASNEVKFSDLTIDFANHSIDDLPYQQQEVTIYDEDDNLKFSGFVSDYKLPELKKIDLEEKELQLSLFSPRQLTIKRIVTIIRTDTLQNILNQVLAPLYEDGFTLKELNIPNKNITVKLISRTVEEVLNYLSNKYALYWNIDELKQITVNSIEYQFNKPVVKEININNYKDEIKGFLSLTPTVENTDYANIINAKNARIFYSDSINLNLTLKSGDSYTLENPIDISYDTAKRIVGDTYTNDISSAIATVTHIQVTYDNNKTAYIISGFNATGEIQDGTNTKGFVYQDYDEEGVIYLKVNADNFFSNLITGFTYKGIDNITINKIESQTFLRYANMKLINRKEIDEKKGKVTPSGQIEKTVNLNEAWFTDIELIEYIKSLFVVNDKQANNSIIKFDKNNEIFVGDRLMIELPEYFMSGNFIVTQIKEITEGNDLTNYEIELKNTNLLENYIDLFRSNVDIEEQASQIETEYIVEYEEEEVIQEIHTEEIYNNKYNTLNFKLRG